VTEKSSTDTLTQSPRTTIQAPADVVDADPHYSSNANLTQQRYQEVVRRLTGKGRIESPSDCHSTALRPRRRPRPNGFCVFDILESEEAVERLARRLARPGRSRDHRASSFLPCAQRNVCSDRARLAPSPVCLIWRPHWRKRNTRPEANPCNRFSPIPCLKLAPFSSASRDSLACQVGQELDDAFRAG
jgi:hypothetical protein